MTPRVVLLSVFDEAFFGLRAIGAYLKSRNAAHVSYITFGMPQDYAPGTLGNGEARDDEFDRPLSYRPEDLDMLGDLLERLRPDLVGISAVSVFHCQIREVTRMARQRLGVPVVWGGAEAIVNPEIAMREADIVCTGDGEEVMIELLEAMEKGNGLQNIAGIWWRDAQGNVCRNAPRPPMPDLDALPAFDWDLRDYYVLSRGELLQGRWHPASYHAQGRRMHTMSGRGCPMHCTYCIHGRAETNATPCPKPPTRRRSVAHFMDELRMHKRNNPDIELFLFSDEIFTFSPAWVREFAPLYRREIATPFVCYTYPKGTSREVIEMLVQAGLRQVLVGVQSGSTRVNREVYGRNTSFEEVMATLHLLNECGIDPIIELIGHNPEENEADCLETLRLLREMPRPATLASVYRLHYFRNYALTDRALDKDMPLTWINPTTAVAHENPEYSFWEALYYLLATQPLSQPTVDFLLQEPVFRRRPEALLEISQAFALSIFHLDHYTSREKKDVVIQRLHGELMAYRGSRLARAFLRLRGALRRLLGKT